MIKEIKVGYRPNPDSKDIPMIRISGKWLKEQLGIKVGDRIRVQIIKQKEYKYNE